LNWVTTEIKKHYLYPSTIFAEKERYQITTILGSCIAVCLYDENMKVAGINHYMLPLWNGNGLASPKFGNVAIEKLVNRMLELRCRKENLVAKVFGGANQTGGFLNIGGRNEKIAIELLKKYEIKVVAKSVGGNVGRKIILDSHTGEVMMRFVKSSKK